MCDKKNSVLFIDTECVVLFSDFKLPDENHVLLRVPRENNMYNVDLKNIVPLGGLTCLFAKATLYESNLWHRRLGHINFRTMNKFVKGKVRKEPVSTQQYVLLPLWSTGSKDPQNTNVDAAFDDMENEFEVYVSSSSSDKIKKHDEKAKREATGKKPVDLSIGVRDLSNKFEEFSVNSTNEVNAASAPVTTVRPNSTNNTNSFNAAGPSDNAVSLNFEIGGKSSFVDPSQYPYDPNMPALEDIVYSDDKEDVGAEANFSNLETSITVSPIPTTRVHKDHPITQIIGDLSSVPQTRSVTQMNPREYTKHSKILVRLKLCKKSFFNSRCKRFRHTQEEGIDYEEVFAPVTRIEAIWLFLACASFMSFMVYQMDVKSSFLYVNIEEEVYVCQPLGFEDPDYPDKVYKVVKALYGLHQAPRAWYETLANYLLENGFQRGKIDHTLFIKKQKGLQVKQKDNGIFMNQDKYVAEILRKFGLTDGKSTSTPIDTKKPLLKDPDGEDVDVHIYRLMIGSLMYLTSSRLDIMFAICACAHFQVTLKVSHLHAVKRIFRYLKGKPHLGLWYPKGSPFNLVAYSNSDYAGASLDRKSTIGDSRLLECSYDSVRIDDRKKVIITEDTIRQALRLDDAAGVDCLLNEDIFAELARMGYKKPSTKLTFYKAFFSAQWKFLIHTILLCDVDDLSSHNTKYTFPALTQKVFANMRRIGKGFSRVDTPLFDGGKIAELDANEDVTLEAVDAEVAMEADDTDEAEPAKVEEVIEVVTAAKLMTKVVTTVVTTITTAQVPKASAPRRRRGVVIQDSEETATTLVIVHTIVKSKDKGKGIIIEEPKPLKRQAQSEQDEAFARQLEAKLKANINWDDVMEEDLKALWKLVKERFESAKPKNFSDDFLLNTLKIMYEKPNVKASVWRDQKGRYGL
nr:hypothetical protein [Tanacetum cinerariifolium]